MRRVGNPDQGIVLALSVAQDLDFLPGNEVTHGKLNGLYLKGDQKSLSRRRRKILVVYAGIPTRVNLIDSLYSFGNYCAEEVSYLNLRYRKVPRCIQKMTFDLIVFHTLFFSIRHDPNSFRLLMQKALPLAGRGVVKVMTPQDEFINAAGVNEFIRMLGIDMIFSSQPESEWPAIYGTIYQSRVRIFQILPGYLDPKRLKKIQNLREEIGKRPLDIGYRTAGLPPAWFGRHGILKQEIANVFVEKARRYGIKTDIATSGAHTLHGDEWLRFLCKCKYTLGVEGGTSILDVDGTIKRRTEEYCKRNPGVGFEDIEKACFPGLDGGFRGYVISPRHLEACATKTCQVLTEGKYNGILVPGKHYISVKQDFSNVNEVLETIVRDDVREQIIDAAYQDIVVSGKYTYKGFVDFVISRSLENSRGQKETTVQAGRCARIVYHRMKLSELLDRAIGVLHRRVFTPMRQRFFGR